MSKINVNQLQENLRTKQFGKRIVFLHTVDSTNNYSKELAAYGAEEGTVVIAETQTAGRGRLSREWISPKGGLYFSIILKPTISTKEAVKLVFVASLAVAKVLDEIYGLKAETKWPNDVLVNGKKICGILAETNITGEKVNFAIIGIGMNANFDVNKTLPKVIAEIATSLENELAKTVSLEQLFNALMEKLEKFYAQFLNEGFAPILSEWKKHASFLGRTVEVSSGTEKWRGMALDVEDDGSLVLKFEDGTVKCFWVGDVSVV